MPGEERRGWGSGLVGSGKHYNRVTLRRGLAAQGQPRNTSIGNSTRRGAGRGMHESNGGYKGLQGWVSGALAKTC